MTPYVNSFETTNFIEYLSIIYGGLTVDRGEVHEYLGMDLEYIKQGTVNVSMI